MTRPGTMQDMSWLLSNFADQVPGVAHVVAVSADGILLASSKGLPPDRADQLSAIAAGVISLTQGTARYFNGGGVLQTIIEMEAGYLFLMSISDGSCLGVLAGRACDVGQVGYEMALLVERVGQALVPAARSDVPPVVQGYAAPPVPPPAAASYPTVPPVPQGYGSSQPSQPSYGSSQPSYGGSQPGYGQPQQQPQSGGYPPPPYKPGGGGYGNNYSA
jgi:predicted regulator of Ras-like GTPase activity (Roadblock/LC7/MglB family)